MNGPYFGNNKTMIVHDLNKAKPECEISKVELKNKKYFDLDTLEQALKEDYKKCRCVS
jgi:hypothetical protein